MNTATSSRDRRRFAACCEKRSTASATRRLTRGGRQREVDGRVAPLAGVLDLPEVHRGRPGEAGDEVGRELLLADVVLRRRVVVELPREADLVLRRRQLLLQPADVGVRLEVGI